MALDFLGEFEEIILVNKLLAPALLHNQICGKNGGEIALLLLERHLRGVLIGKKLQKCLVFRRILRLFFDRRFFRFLLFDIIFFLKFPAPVKHFLAILKHPDKLVRILCSILIALVIEFGYCLPEDFAVLNILYILLDR